MILETARAVAGTVLLLGGPGFFWTLAVRPDLRRDAAALVFWTIGLSLVWLVLYGTALAAVGAFRAGPLVGAALAVAAAGAVVAWLRRHVAEGDADDANEAKQRTDELRGLKVDATMRSLEGKPAAAARAREAAKAVETRETRRLYGGR